MLYPLDDMWRCTDNVLDAFLYVFNVVLCAFVFALLQCGVRPPATAPHSSAHVRQVERLTGFPAHMLEL